MRGAAKIAALLLTLFAVARPTAAAERIVVQLRWEPQFQFAGYYAALWQGYYAEAGLDVEIRPGVLPDGTVLETTEEVQAGRAHVGIGATDALVANDDGVRLSVLSSIFQHSAMRIYVQPELRARSLTDFALLRAPAAADTSLAMIEFQALLAAEGLDPRLLSPVEVGSRGRQAFLDGEIDLWPTYSLDMDWVLRSRRATTTVLDPARFGVDFYGDSIFARTDAVHDDPAIYQSFVEATLRGWQYAFSHPAELSRRLVNEFDRVKPVQDEYEYNLFQHRVLREHAQYGIAELGNTSPFRWQRLHDLLRETGFVARPYDADFVLSPDELVANDHVRMLRWLPWAAAGLVALSALALLFVVSLRRTVQGRTAELRASNARLREQTELLLDAEDIAALGHWHLDVATGEMLWSRPVFRMHGLDPERGTPTLVEAQTLQHPDDRRLVMRHLNAAVRGGTTFDFEFRLLLPRGEVRYLASKGRVGPPDEKGRATSVFGILMDITERKLAAQQIEYLAYHDPLTGLPNRALFQDRLQMALAAQRRTAGRVAVLMLDLDGFKQVNDSYGHPAGDMLLKAVAERIGSVTRETDTVCRLGGDEFTVLLTNLSDPQDAEHIADKILAAVGAPFDLGATHIRPRASVGIHIVGEQATTALEVLSNADVALYRAKVGNRGGLMHFEAHMRLEKDRFAVEADDIRQGLKRGEFVLHWQPIFSADDHTYRGSEILIRWQRPGHGLIPPGAFLPVAKECGLMDDLDAWVLGAALAEREASDDPVVRSGFITVNMSGDLLISHAMRESVLSIIERYRPPDGDINLILEVTEDVAINAQVDAAARTLRQLADRGVAIALDDFGTGHGTLSDLRRFPIHFIKIDREFVDRIDQRADSTAIVTSVVWLAHSMGITTIAEGIERPEEVKRLTELGCEMLQGYHFAKPMPRASVERLLAATQDGTTGMHDTAAA